MDRIKTECKYDIDDIPIEYVTPDDLEHKSFMNRTCRAVIIPKCDLKLDNTLNSLDISVCEPTILERYDYPKCVPTTLERFDSKNDVEKEDSLNGPELAHGPTILERYDYTKSVPSTTDKKCCEICKTFGVKGVIPPDRQINELYNVCQECSSNYLPTLALTKLRNCQICQSLVVETPSIGQRKEIDGLCSSCSPRFLPTVFLQPLETPRSRFQCYVCKFTFDRSETLTQHMEEHNAPKMMTTAVQNASTKKCLKSNSNHFKLHPPDESPNIKRHSCNQCGYATAFISNLIRHYRKHNDVKKVKVKKFECQDCGRKFAEKRSLVDHGRIHWDDDAKLKSEYKCDVCGYSTLWVNRLKIHMQIHVAERPFECGVCSKRFFRKNTLKRHELSHCSDKPFECNICSKKYRVKTALTYHMQTSHVDKALRTYKYTCYICKYNSMSLSYLRIHMRRHSGIRPFQCRFCPRRFAVKYTCTVHEATHTEPKRFFKCEICNANLASKTGLRGHMETHLLESQRNKKFSCNECDSRFYQKKSLLRHHQSKHNVTEEQVRQVCQKCSKEFTTIRSLKVHMTIHGKYPFDCRYCARHFSSAEKLERHENAKHKIAKFGRQRFECYVCKLSVKNRWTLQHHFRKHSGARPFRCNTCSKGFMLKSTLQRHQQSHWSDADKLKLKKYKCQLCDYRTARRYHLNVHLDRHVKGPFRCAICSKEFPTEGRLSYHQRAHTGIYRNTYVCYICNYVGVNITCIREHLFKHSNDKPFRCETCNKFFKRSKTLKLHQVTHLDRAEFDKLKKRKCHLCDYATRNGHNLKRHILTHTGGGVKNAACTKCPMKFSDKTQLKAHMSTHLDDSQRIKAFKCNACGLAFAACGNLKRHIANKHSNTKPYACDKCPQKYSDPSSMKKHLRAHVETPYFCSQCTRKFAHKSDLTKHTATHKSKRFSCKLCPSKFTMNYHLKRHTHSAHSGLLAASVSCTKCTKKFTDKSALNRHLRTHDNVPKYRAYECYVCQYSCNLAYKLKQHLSQH